MNKLEFESVLYKESVKALYILCRGSEDIITFEESLEHFARFRPIILNAQIMKYTFNKKNNCEITFVFSPNYMFDNDSITICYYLNYLTWKLILPKYDYDDIDEIDEILIGETDNLNDTNNPILGNTQTLTLVGVGVTATAVVGIVTFGGIRFITVSNRGGGYTSTPIVGISSAPSGGKTGIATATMIGGIVVCTDNVNTSAQSVQSVQIINPGLGYTSVPGVRFIGGGGSGAAATATIGNNIIGIVTVTSGGSGYSTSPTITFTNQIFNIGVSTVSAAATAIVSAAGTITAIRITNAGLGYSVAPSISISQPSMTSSGTFIFNETVTGSSSGTTAKVRTWSSITNVLEISNVSGAFVIGENIVGTASSASHQLRNIDLNPNNDGFADNSSIETEADLIIDFSEKNPFGTP